MTKNCVGSNFFTVCPDIYFYVPNDKVQYIVSRRRRRGFRRQKSWSGHAPRGALFDIGTCFAGEEKCRF